MRNLIGLLLIFAIGLMSCENRKTQKQALSESIEVFKKEASLEVDLYQPETYVEREVDTLFSNGYRIKIKTSTDMVNNVLFTKIKDTINYQTYYRNYKFNISVEKEGKVIYNESFNKVKANKALNYNANYALGSRLYDFDRLAVLKSIQIDDDLSIKNGIAINIMYAIPETNKYASHRLFIDENGTSNIINLPIN